jgi:hypothetical protein
MEKWVLQSPNVPQARQLRMIALPFGPVPKIAEASLGTGPEFLSDKAPQNSMALRHACTTSNSLIAEAYVASMACRICAALLEHFATQPKNYAFRLRFDRANNARRSAAYFGGGSAKIARPFQTIPLPRP